MQNKKRTVLIFGLVALIIFIVVGFRININPFTQRALPPFSASPALYYEFDGTQAKSPVSGTSPTFGTGDPSDFTLNTNGPNGKYISTNEANNTYVEIGNSAILNNPTGLSIAFNLKINKLDYNVSLLQASDRRFDIGFWVDKADGRTSDPKLVFYTTHANNATIVDPNATNLTYYKYDTQIVSLDGVGPKSIDYYMDGNWHSFVYVFTGTEKQIWVDGMLADGFTKTVMNYNNLGSANPLTNTAQPIYFNPWKSTAHLNGSIDSVAFYNVALPGNFIDDMDYQINTAHANYPTNSPAKNSKTPLDVVAPVDPSGFLDNSDLSTTIPYTTPTSGNFPNSLTQIKTIPLPRYSSTNSMERLANWNDLTYLLEDSPNHSVPTPTTVKRAKEFNKEQATKWNYMIDIGRVVNSDPSNLNWNNSWNLQSEMLNLANTAPYTNIPTSLITNRAQLRNPNCWGWVETGSSGQDSSLYNMNCLRGNYMGTTPVQYPTTKFFQNSGGTFINQYGQGVGNTPVSPVGGQTYSNTNYTNKFWRPLYSASDSSLSSYYQSDGNVVASGIAIINNYLTNRGTKINLIAENGEIVAPYDVLINSPNIDPLVSAQMNAINYTDGKKFWNKAFAEQEIASYVNPILNSAVGAKYEMYKMSTPDDHTWSEVRKIQSDIQIGNNTDKLSTIDFYPRYLNNWGSKYSAWIGTSAISWQVYNGHQSGDKFFRPYVAPAWDPNVTHGAAAGQQLGMINNLVNMGAVSMYPSYFFDVEYENGYPQVAGIVNYAASYKQAVYSRVQNLYENSDVLGGDVYCDGQGCQRDPGASGVVPGYLFKDGFPTDWITVRKHNTSNIYLISGNINRVTNMQGSIPEVRKATIKLNNSDISFDIREQGSTYVYDNSGPNPVFYQLDGWHEYKHPTKWSKDFSIEAELFDVGTATIKTEGSGVAIKNFSNINGENYTSYINPNSGTIEYNFEPRYFDINDVDNDNPISNGNPKTYYLWYRASSTSGSATATFNVDNNNSKNVSVSNTNSYVWCNKDENNNPITFTVTNNVSHKLNFIGTTAFKFDQFLLTENSNGALKPNACAGSLPTNLVPTVNITTPATSTYTATTATLAMAGTATDTDGTIASMTWTNSAEAGIPAHPITITPGTTVNWTTNVTLIANSTNNITIFATDNSSGVGTKILTVTYNVDVTPPTVTTSSPISNSTVLNTIALTATAVDNESGISTVQFYRKISGGTATAINTTGQTHTGNVYTQQFDTKSLSNGVYIFYAQACNTVTPTNLCANSTDITNVTVNNPVILNPDETAPVVTWNTPTVGSTVTGNVNLSVNSSDPVVPGATTSLVTNVTFKYKKSTDANYTTITTSGGSGGVYQVAWNTGSLSNGTYSLQAISIDGASNTTTVTLTPVTVNNTVSLPDVIVTDILPVSGSINSPITLTAVVKNQGTGATPTIPPSSTVGVLFTITGVVDLTWSDNYSTSIPANSTVNLTANGGTSGQSWTPVSAGTYTITAQVDDINRFAESNENNNIFTKTITISSNPTVTWISPLNGSNVKLGETYSLQVLPTGNVVEVRLKKNLLSAPIVLNAANNWTKPWKISTSAKINKTVTWEAVGYDANGNAVTPPVSTTVTRIAP